MTARTATKTNEVETVRAATALHAQALDEVEQWRQQIADAQQHLEALHARKQGTPTLENAHQYAQERDRTARDTEEAQSVLQVLRDGLGAAQARERNAARALAGAEAEALTPDIERAQRLLRDHRAEITSTLSKLGAATGANLDGADLDHYPSVQGAIKVVDRLVLRRDVLRAASRGVDRAGELEADNTPAILAAGGLLASPNSRAEADTSVISQSALSWALHVCHESGRASKALRIMGEAMTIDPALFPEVLIPQIGLARQRLDRLASLKNPSPGAATLADVDAWDFDARMRCFVSVIGVQSLRQVAVRQLTLAVVAAWPDALAAMADAIGRSTGDDAGALEVLLSSARGEPAGRDHGFRF